MIDVQELYDIVEPRLSDEKIERVMNAYQYKNLSVANRFRVLLSKLPPKDRKAVFNELPPAAIVALSAEWPYRARPDQLAPDAGWRTWVNCAGRGCGKSISGLNWITEAAWSTPGNYLVAGKSDPKTREDMFKPILALLKDRGMDLGTKGCVDQRDGIVRLPNGSVIYSGAGTTLAENVRGANLTGVHLDELCVWADPMLAYKQARLATRKGRAQIYISTTPLVTGSANALIKSLIGNPTTHYTVTHAYANLENLAPGQVHMLLEDEGKRIAEEEIWAKVLSDAGAMFSQALLSDDDEFAFHFVQPPPLEFFDKIVIAYDPAGKATRDEHGIIVVGMKRKMHRGTGQLLPHFWVLEDQSDNYSPNQAAEILAKLYHRYQANSVVVEVNNGWDWIPAVIKAHDSTVHITEVTATRGKAIRAEPTVGHFEQRRVHFQAKLGKLEDELVMFTPDTRISPNRADALVWGLTHLDEKLARPPRPLPFDLG